MHAFVLGATPTKRLAIIVLSFPSPASDDVYHWLPCEVCVSAGGFSGAFKASFLPGELHQLLQDLERVYRDLKGEAVFAALEQQLTFTLTCSPLGHVRVAGVATSRAVPDGNALHFAFELDQTDLGSSIHALQRVLEVCSL